MNNLERLRWRKGLTQEELAEKVGISLRMIQKYESGERDIQKAQAQTVRKITQALECSIEDIIRTKEQAEQKRQEMRKRGNQGAEQQGEKIYLIFHDSMDDDADIIGYIKGTEDDAARYCSEYNLVCEYSWQEVWWEELTCLNKVGE